MKQSDSGHCERRRRHVCFKHWPRPESHSARTLPRAAAANRGVAGRKRYSPVSATQRTSSICTQRPPASRRTSAQPRLPSLEQLGKTARHTPVNDHTAPQAIWGGSCIIAPGNTLPALLNARQKVPLQTHDASGTESNYDQIQSDPNSPFSNAPSDRNGMHSSFFST
jgi:hypothetical protein